MTLGKQPTFASTSKRFEATATEIEAPAARADRLDDPPERNADG